MAGGGIGVRGLWDRSGWWGGLGPTPSQAGAAASRRRGVVLGFGTVVGAWIAGVAPWAGNPGSRAAGRHRPSPVLCATGPVRGGVTEGLPAALASGPLSPGRGAWWAQTRPEKGGHGSQSRRLLGPRQAAAPVAGQAAAAAPSSRAAEGSRVRVQEGAPSAKGDLSREPGSGTAPGLGQ